MPETEKGPFLIFSSGQRTGSTLLQRFLSSHPDILIWGEHDGILTRIFAGFERFIEWDEMFGQPQRETFLHKGINNFIPNMTPPREIIEQAQEQTIRNLWQVPAQNLGRSIWGFKEVLYGADMAYKLHRIFPNLRIIYLTRNVFEVFISLLHEEGIRPEDQPHVPLEQVWTRARTLECVDTWIRVNHSFLTCDICSEEWIFPVKYEDLVGDQEAVTRRLVAWLGLEYDDFDLDVFNHKIYTERHNGPDRRPVIRRCDLTPEEVALLTTDDILEIAEWLDYDMSVPQLTLNPKP